MNDNNIFVDFKLEKSKISSFLIQEFDKLPQKHVILDDMTINFKLSENGGLKISARDKSVFAELPVMFDFIRPAGLFSIEGNGAIKIKIEIQCNLDHNFVLTTHTILLGYDWITEPVLHAGQLNIPIETISDCIIRYFKDDVLQKADERIAALLEIKKYINDQILAFGPNYMVHKKPDLYFNFQLLQVQSDVFYEDAENIYLDLWLEIESKISDDPLKFEISPDPRFYWIESKPKDHVQKINIKISYTGLSKMILEEMNGREMGGKAFETESINIRYTTFLEIKISLTEPLKGLITIQCQPYLDRAAQKIFGGDIQIDVHASNFIYKLSSPIIEKIIRSRIESFLPLEASPYFDKFTQKIPVIKLLDNQISLRPKFNSIKIDSLLFSNAGIESSVYLENAKIDIVT